MIKWWEKRQTDLVDCISFWFECKMWPLNDLPRGGGGGGGGTDLEMEYGDVRPWRPPFHASPVVRKGPISSKRVSSQDPILRKFWNFSLYSLNFHPNFSSQAPKFGNFQFTSPPIQRQISVCKPHTSEIRAAHPYLKKSWVPPPPPTCHPENGITPLHQRHWNVFFQKRRKTKHPVFDL